MLFFGSLDTRGDFYIKRPSSPSRLLFTSSISSLHPLLRSAGSSVHFPFPKGLYIFVSGKRYFSNLSFEMKFSIFAVGFLVSLAAAAPSSLNKLNKRASAAEAASVGYATLNGGTTGGAGGTTTTVSSLAALQTAATSSGKKVIVVKGTITGNTVIKVAADKTIVGADYNASMFLPLISMPIRSTH